MISHNPSTDLDTASAYQSYGQEEGDDGGVTTGFEGLRSGMASLVGVGGGICGCF